MRGHGVAWLLELVLVQVLCMDLYSDAGSGCMGVAVSIFFDALQLRL